MNKKMRLAASSSLLYALSVGFAITYSSTATVKMNSPPIDVNSDKTAVSWIGSILALGALFGGIFGSYLADKLGRKGVLLLISLPFLSGWLLIAFADSLGMILSGRFLTGFCCGVACVVVPIYVVEISVPEIRGLFGASFQTSISAGVLLLSSFGAYLDWRWLAIAGACCPAIAALFMYFMPESPRWLIANKKVSRAEDAIKFLYGRNVDANSECALIAQNLSSYNVKLHVREICDSSIYKPALLSLGLMFFQQFSGSYAVLFYTVSIFQQAEKSVSAVEANVYVAGAMAVCTSLSAQFVDRFGRRKFLIASGFLMSLSLTALGLFIVVSSSHTSVKTELGWVPLICLIVYVAAFSIGLGPIPWLMMAEMSPMRARSIICGMGTAVSWLFVFVVTKSFIDLEQSIGDYSTYFMYAIFCFLSCFFTWFLLPETNKRPLDEISSDFTFNSHVLLEQPEVLHEDEVFQSAEIQAA